MKIKVCGMKNPENIEAILEFQPDFMGFIFYKQSKRYVDNELDIAEIVSNNTKKVGVFVNSPISRVLEIVAKHKLDLVQLHGNESVDYLRDLSSEKVKIIKVFQISEHFNWSETLPFEEYSNYFLFDTATKNYGGSGLKFEWNQLKNYSGKLPFFLSGGISLDDVESIKKLSIPLLYGVDINSKFESSPGNKKTELVKTMINLIQNESNISSK